MTVSPVAAGPARPPDHRRGMDESCAAVNDVDLEWFRITVEKALRVTEVEVGLRGAVRRLLLGVLPKRALEAVAQHFLHGDPVGIR